MGYKVRIKDIQNKYKFKIFCGGYNKPVSGIPLSDLAEAVQKGIFKELDGGNARIWTLDDGLYLLPQGFVLYYKGTSDTEHYFTCTTTGFLFVASYRTNASNTLYKQWYVLRGNNGSTRYLTNGYSTASNGEYSSFDIGKSYLEYSMRDTIINSSSTDQKIPTSKAVWNAIKDFFTKPSTGIPKTDLADDVQTSLGKADTALQTEQYTGTITGIKMNGTSKGTSGVVDLGTVITEHQDISGKEDKSNKKNAINSTLTNDDYVCGKAIYEMKENIEQSIQSDERRISALEKREGKCYTVVRKITSNSSSVWTRADDAVGLVANANIGSLDAVQNDFNNIYPWCDIKDCNVDSNGNPTHFIGESGFTRNEEVYVYIPKHWIHREKYVVEEDNVENTYEKISIYDYNAPGSIEIAPYMVGKYHTSDSSGTHVSKTGLEPLNNTTRATFRTKARAKGSKWSLLDWHIFDLQFLYLVEYADYNCETKVGAGFIYGDICTSALASNNTNKFVTTSLPTGFYIGKTISIGSDRGNYGVARSRKITAIEDYDDGTITGKEVTFDGTAVNLTTSSKMWASPEFSGTLDDFGNLSGCLANDQKHTVIYRGIENLWGLEWQHVDGISIKDAVTYLSTDYTSYQNDKFDGTYSAVGYTNATTSDKYIKELGYDTTCAKDDIKTLVAMPTVVGGASTTYVCDNYWYSAGNRIFCVGGPCSTNGSKYGLFASSCNFASSHSTWHYGSRLLIHTSQ